jgi:hypothetical protein
VNRPECLKGERVYRMAKPTPKLCCLFHVQWSFLNLAVYSLRVAPSDSSFILFPLWPITVSRHVY